MFAIGFIDPSESSDLTLEPHEALGRIHLDDYSSLFLSSLRYWSVRDYEHHWKAQAAELLAGQSAAFVTTIDNPPEQSHIFRWLAYPFESEIRFHEHLLAGGGATQRSPNDWQFVPQHDRYSADDGRAISEWAIERDAVVAWLDSHPI